MTEKYIGGIDGVLQGYTDQAIKNILTENTAWTLDKWQAFYDRTLKALIEMGMEENEAKIQMEDIDNQVKSQLS